MYWGFRPLSHSAFWCKSACLLAWLSVLKKYETFYNFKGRNLTRDVNVRKVLRSVLSILVGPLHPCWRLLYFQDTHQWLLLRSGFDMAITLFSCVCVCIFVFLFCSVVLISTIGLDNYCNKWIPLELVDNEFSDCVCVSDRTGFGLLTKHWGNEWRHHVSHLTSICV